MRLTKGLVVVAMVIVGSRLDAQFAYDGVRAGDRVRLRVANEVTRAPKNLRTRGLTGTVRAVAPDTLYLDPSSTPQAVVPRIFIQSVDVSEGPASRRSSAGQMALVGALLGIVVPPVLPKRTAPFLRWPDEGRVVGVSVGLVAGALAGFLFPFERWRPAWIP